MIYIAAGLRGWNLLKRFVNSYALACFSYYGSLRWWRHGYYTRHWTENKRAFSVGLEDLNKYKLKKYRCPDSARFKKLISGHTGPKNFPRIFSRFFWKIFCFESFLALLRPPFFNFIMSPISNYHGSSTLSSFPFTKQKSKFPKQRFLITI